MRTVISKSPQETSELGKKLAGKAKIICLYGDLGSGKTTFVQGFAKGLGIVSRLLSPTFIIVRRYEIPKSGLFFYHIDLYRIQRKEDIEGLGLGEILRDPSAIIIIEWAEKLKDFLPILRQVIKFTVLPDGNREIQFV